MEPTNSSRTQMQIAGRAAHKFNYSAPASPAAAIGSPSPATAASMTPAHANSSPASGAASTGVSSALLSNLTTPKKHLLDAVMLQRIREKLRTPGGAGELPALWNQLECTTEYEPVNVIKDRYLISTQPSVVSAAAAAKTPASYRHLIDLTCSNLKCTDVFTEEQFLCKIINEPLHKVQRAYFQLQQEGERCCSTIYDHPLIRGVHDIVPLSKQRTYVIIAAPPTAAQQQSQECAAGVVAEQQCGIYEDLHTYIRNKRRLCETEARALFHQICQTVQVCHRNGIILRDLKLKRFYFIDEARTKLQYESLEGSMILDNPVDDTLSDKIGCPLYTAPELLCPNPTYRGKPADMWSLGVILYTMLVGQYPFYEKGNCNLITVIRHCHVQIPSSLSRSVRMLLLALLRKNYEERMPAEHIFYSPWLREQRAYYMYIPVDVYIPDDDEEQAQQLAAEASDVSSQVATSTEEQPLDYTCTALQMECDSGNSSNHDDAGSSSSDVEMG